MDLTDDQIIALLRPRIPKGRIDGAMAYLDTQIKVPGEHISMGRKEYPVPFESYFVFVDLMPSANWGHAAMGVFISGKGDRISAVDTDFPPFWGNPPETFRKLVL